MYHLITGDLNVKKLCTFIEIFTTYIHCEDFKDVFNQELGVLRVPEMIDKTMVMVMSN